MAHADTLPVAVLDAVASKVGAPLAELRAVAKQAQPAVELGETCSVWSLGPTAILTPDADFPKLVTQTGRWHHPIKVSGKAAAFARSMPLGANASSWDVIQLFQSDISEKIDQAVDWVDGNAKGDPVVRLLIAPSYYLHAFWLSDGQNNHVYVIDVPASFTHVRPSTRYSAKEFLQKLAKEEPASGFIP
jgi:hypothetical protein